MLSLGFKPGVAADQLEGAMTAHFEKQIDILKFSHFDLTGKHLKIPDFQDYLTFNKSILPSQFHCDHERQTCANNT